MTEDDKIPSKINKLIQRINGLESRLGSLEETIIEKIGDLKSNFDRLGVDIEGLTERHQKMEMEMLKMLKEVGKAARKAELSKLESLIEIYNPVKSMFVTKEEVQKMIDEKRV